MSDVALCVRYARQGEGTSRVNQCGSPDGWYLFQDSENSPNGTSTKSSKAAYVVCVRNIFNASLETVDSWCAAGDSYCA